MILKNYINWLINNKIITENDLKEKSFNGSSYFQVKSGLTHNQNIYGLDVYENLGDLDINDWKFICNKFAKLARYDYDNCMDNERFCKSDKNKSMTEDYKHKYNHGCCGFTDYYITNHVTGNSFWIGYNYGH